MTVRISSFTSLTPSKPTLYVLLIENVTGKLSTDPVGAGTIPHCSQKCILRWQLRTADWRMEKAAWQLVVNGMVLRHVFKSGNMFMPSFGNKKDLLVTTISDYFTIISLLFHYYFLLLFRHFSPGFESRRSQSGPDFGVKAPTPPPPRQFHSPTPGGALEVWPWTSSA